MRPLQMNIPTLNTQDISILHNPPLPRINPHDPPTPCSAPLNRNTPVHAGQAPWGF